MKLKMDENGNVVVQDGKPVYVKDDGTDLAYDANQAQQTITARNAEAKQHRERAEKAEADLTKFAGIGDPAKAIEALKTVQNLDDKKLIDAGEVESVKKAITDAHAKELAQVNDKLGQVTNQYHQSIIGGAFSRSKFIADKLVIPADMAQSFFGANFSVTENGQLVAKDANGTEIRDDMGNYAGFDDALGKLLALYPNRDSILKPSGNAGTGNHNNGASNGSVNPWKPESWNMTKQGEVFKSNPALARSMAAEYGHAIN